MKNQFENVRESVLDVAFKLGTEKNGLHVTVESNQHLVRHVAPFVHERYSYIAARAGTPGMCPDSYGYRTYALITLVCNHDRNEYELIQDYRGVGGEFRRTPVTCNEETLAVDYGGVVEHFMRQIA